jgi:serine/threonine protein kinase
LSESPQDTTDKLASLLLRWEEAWDLGEEISAGELCVDCPELSEPLERQIATLKKMSWMKADVTEDDETEGTDELLGATLGNRYRIEERIGEGGYGRVYRAFDPELERHIAIKLSKSKTNTQSESLLEEARRAARLRHPGIVAVHDVGRHDGQLFFVTELIDGRNMAEVIAQNSRKPAEAVRLVAEVADALQFAHEQGFIHRDIKPANILIDQQGRPQIADFGIAVTLDELTDGEPAISGTLPYLAPERVAGEVQLIDGRTDIHALGVMLYELLTGQLPYQGRTPTAIREQILLRQPKSPRLFNPAVSKRIEAVCLRAMAKHPADRFANANEMALALRASVQTSQRQLWIIGVIVVLFGLMLSVFKPWQNDGDSPSNNAASPSAESEDVFVFDGTSRIVTPVERFAPVTLEAWVKPSRVDVGCHFLIGSDVPTKFGLGIGICGTTLSAEQFDGLVRSSHPVPVGEWSHIAAVFSSGETRLYLNGKLVHTGAATKPVSVGVRFVIGNVGLDSPLDYFSGRIRCVRISTGERYNTDFVPDEEFVNDSEEAPHRAILIYDGSTTDGNRVIDLSGNGNDGVWERLSR